MAGGDARFLWCWWADSRGVLKPTADMVTGRIDTRTTPGFFRTSLFPASGFSPCRVFPGGGVFQRRVFAQSSGIFPGGAVASSSQPRVKGQGCSRQRGGVNPVPHRQRAPAQEHDAGGRRTQVADRGPGCVRTPEAVIPSGWRRTEKAAQVKGGRRGERSSLTLTAASARCLETSCVLAVSGANAGWKTGPALSMACPRGPRSESTDCE